MAAVNRFGTTSDMIIQEIPDVGPACLLAIDAKGLYLTTPGNVDSPLADVNRYGVNRLEFINKLEELGYSPYDLFEEHKDKIKVAGSDAGKKKLNPIKASKRGM